MLFKKKPHPYRWVVWSLALLFLFYEFFLRVFPTVMVDPLMKTFCIGAGELGFLSAVYFYSYAPCQIPAGILMDRFGARKLLTFASFICGLGSILFGVAQKIHLAEIGRFFMGIGSAFAFIAMIYISSHWFEKKYRALLIGVGNSIGLLGAIGGEGPLSSLVDLFGWRQTVLFLGYFGLVLALVLFLVIRREKPSHDQKKFWERKKPAKFYHNFIEVAKHWKTWHNASINLFYFMTTSAFAGLWGVPYLQTAFGYSRETAAFAISIIYVGFIFGGPVFGHLSDKIKRRKPVLLFSSIIVFLTMLPILYAPHIDVFWMFVLLTIVGFFSGASLLTFSLSIEINEISYKGTAISLTNFLTAIATAFTQDLIGYLLDFVWSGKMEGGIRVYTSYDYRLALTAFPVTLLIAIFLILFFNEKKHRMDRFQLFR